MLNVVSIEFLCNAQHAKINFILSTLETFLNAIAFRLVCRYFLCCAKLTMAFVSVLLCSSEFMETVTFVGSLAIKQLETHCLPYTGFYFLFHVIFHILTKYFKSIGIFVSFCLKTETSNHLGWKRLPWPNKMT